jgi:pimeloyl-ACP methyl ester carboxylesterase
MWDAFGRLMASDTDLEAMTPMRFQYATRLVQPGPLRRIPTFDTVADSLKEFMDTEAEGFSHLALVAHSQGGLVVQRFLARMLIEGRGEELKRIRRVVLFACPNNGSELGLKLRRWTLRANPQERQLRPFDEQITDTQGIVLRDIVNADVATERTCPIPFSVYAGETDNVVAPASARGVFPDAGVLPGDHFTIVRPDTTRHRSYTTRKRLLLAAADTDPPTDIAISRPGRRPTPIPPRWQHRGRGPDGGSPVSRSARSVPRNRLREAATRTGRPSWAQASTLANSVQSFSQVLAKPIWCSTSLTTSHTTSS